MAYNGNSVATLQANLQATDRARELTRQLENSPLAPRPERPQDEYWLELLDKDVHPYQPTIDAAVVALDRALANMGAPVEHEFFAGAWPAPNLNALAYQTPGGTVILINDGTQEMVAQVAALLLLLTDMRDTPHEALAGRQLYSAEDIGWQFIKGIAAYNMYGDAGRNFLLAPQGGVRAAMASGVAWGALAYVIAHELAHVMLGHVLASADLSETSCLDSVARSSADELAADSLAAEILCHLDDAGGESIAIDFASAGPELFLTLVQVIDEFRAAMKSPPTKYDTGHPAPEERLHAIRTVFMRELGAETVELSKDFSRSVVELYDWSMRTLLDFDSQALRLASIGGTSHSTTDGNRYNSH